MSSVTAPTTPVAASSPINALVRSTVAFWGGIGFVVGGVVGLVVGNIPGLVIGLVAGGIALGSVAGVSLRRFVSSALEVVVGDASAGILDAVEAPRLFNLLQGLCASAGVGVPAVSVSEDPGINAMVAADPARDRSAELVVTRGFIEGLERIEMEGAVAVCLARLKSGLVEAQTLAVALAMSSPWFVPAPIRRNIATAASASQAVFDGDVKGVGITRYPPGLAAAFEQMLAGSTAVSGADARSAVLWLANPAGESGVGPKAVDAAAEGSRVDGSSEERPPLSERLALLREI